MTDNIFKELINKAFHDGLRAAANGDVEMFNLKVGFISGIRQSLIILGANSESVEIAERSMKDMMVLLKDITETK